MAILPLLIVSYTVSLSCAAIDESSAILLQNESFSDENREIYVTMAYDLHMFIPNLIRIHTNWEHLRLTYATKPADTKETIEDNVLHKVSPITDGWYGAEIKYHVPFYDIQPNMMRWHKLSISLLMCGRDACPESKIREMVIPFKVNPTFLYIIGEIEQTRYRPGETVKARFHVLNAQSTAITTESLTTPRFLLSPVNTSNFGAKEILPATNLLNPTDENFTCTSLVIRGEGMEYERRLDVPAHKTIYVNFELWEGERQGTWLIELECMHHRKVVTFLVNEPMSEPFHAYMVPTGSVSTESANIDFRVCAIQTDGSFIKATVSALVCVCAGDQNMRFPLPQGDTDRLFDEARCFEEHGEARRCESQTKQLSEGCVDFRISTYSFKLNDLNAHSGNEHVLYCFRVLESRTGIVISKCEHSRQLENRGAWLSPGDTAYYHPGLPLQVVVNYWHPGAVNTADQLIQLDIAQVVTGCRNLEQNVDPSKFVAYFFRGYNHTDSTGQAVYTVPPIRSTGFMRMIAAIHEFNRTKMYHDHIGYLDQMMLSERTWKPWPSISGAHLQVWLQGDGRVQGSCISGSADVKLISNLPLSGRVIWIETYTSGYHNLSFIPALDNGDIDKCQPMDNEFGHYNCTGEGITCSSGWDGDDCLTPVCADKCSPIGGWCRTPGECVCKQGWSGSSCHTCLPCDFIRCSSISYQECICEYPTSNYTCPTLETVIMKPQTKPPARTIYQRDIRINIDFKFGKGSRVLFYFYQPIRQGRQERVIAEVFVETPDCYPPAHAVKTSFEVFTKLVASGSEISMEFELPYGFQEENETEVCHVRTTVPSHHPSQIPNHLEWRSYRERLYSFWSNRWDILHSPADPLEAFQSAGLMMFNIGELAQLNRDGACPDMDTLVNGEIDEFKLYDGFMGADPKTVDDGAAYHVEDIYEPAWLFQPLDRVVKPNGALGIEITTNFSEKYTSLAVQLICTTRDSGIWIGQSPEISTTWVTRSTLAKPSLVIVGVSTHLNLTLLLSQSFQCGQIVLHLEMSPQDMLPTTADTATFCMCSNASKVWSFGVVPVRTGYLNFSTVTTFIPLAPLCNPTTEQLVNSSTVVERHTTSEDHDLFTGISGVKSTVHFTNLICHPHDTYLTLSTSVLENFEYGTAQVVDKIYVHTMCTFDYFPGELERTHRSAPWITNKAEELLSRIVAASSYIIYIKSPQFLGHLPKLQHISPLKNELAAMLTRLKHFTRSDGSISNFGKDDRSGSVWLSAEALRATELAGKVGYYDGHVSLQLKNILDFIGRQINPTTGCMKEIGTEIPFVLHGMAGRMSTELQEQMLTAYVTAAINEQPHIFSNFIIPYADNIQAINEKLRQCFIWGRNAHTAKEFHKLSNFHIALAAYAASLLKAEKKYKEALISNMLLRNVTIWSKDRRILMFYLTDDTGNAIGKERNTIATEATAYMYLTLVSAHLFPGLLLPIVKYIVQNHEWEPHAQSTHSSALVKQVLSDYFSSRVPNLGFATESIICTTALYPVGHVNFEELKHDEVYKSRYVTLPPQERSTLREIKQGINGLLEGQCALVDTSLSYRSEYKGLSSRVGDIFSITVKYLTFNGPTQPVVEVCFHFIPQITPERTGYLIMEVRPPEYTQIVDSPYSNEWRNNQSEATLLRPRSGGIDHTGSLVFTFDGVSRSEINTATDPTAMRRCAQVEFHTIYFADNPDPVFVKVYDFHRLYPVTRYTFTLPTLRKQWNIDERSYLPGAQAVTSSGPCPSCMDIEMISDSFMIEMRRTICRKRGDALVFEVVQAPFQSGDTAIMYTTRMVNVMNSWSTKLILPNDTCNCTIPKDTTYMIAFTKVPFDYSALDDGYFFNVTASTKSIHLLMIKDDRTSVRRMNNALSRPPVGPACAKLQMALQFIYSNILIKS